MDEYEITTIAIKAGLIEDQGSSGTFLYHKEKLKRFAALVAAHEREILLKDNPYLAEQLQAYIHIATTVEREACAKVCDARTGEPGWCCADAIRARGEK